jgi:hypothetical protein
MGVSSTAHGLLALGPPGYAPAVPMMGGVGIVGAHAANMFMHEDRAISHMSKSGLMPLPHPQPFKKIVPAQFFRFHLFSFEG